MDGALNTLALKMAEYERDCPERIQHFIKVHAFAKLVSELEGTDENTRRILEAAAYVHDIGIKPSLIKYGNCEGKHQEAEGPAPAKKMLEELGFNDDFTERVCFLVAHHHSYENVSGDDWQILLEADFLVNSYEGSMKDEAIIAGRNSFFRTESGKKILDTMFDL